MMVSGASDDPTDACVVCSMDQRYADQWNFERMFDIEPSNAIDGNLNDEELSDEIDSLVWSFGAACSVEVPAGCLNGPHVDRRLRNADRG